MARRAVRKRTDLTHYPDLPWLAECSNCTWQKLLPTWPRAFGLAVRHTVCLGFGRG